MQDTKVILEKGTGKTAKIQDVQIPDLWHLAMWLKDCSRNPSKATQPTREAYAHMADMVLETWHTAHALKAHIAEH